MQKVLLVLMALLLTSPVYAQLNTFSEGDVISAQKMNENFESLLKQTTGPVEVATTVNCGSNGSGINEAIAQGFNVIQIQGTCKENLSFGLWRLVDEEPAAYNNAPSYLRIFGDGSSKIVDNSSNQDNVITVDGGKTLILENLTVEGGRYGVSGLRNSNVLLSNVTVQNFTERGISINDSSYFGVDKGGLTVTTNQVVAEDIDQFGIRFVAGSSGWLHTVEVSNVREGIALFGGSMTYAYSFNIHDVETAIRVGDSSFLKYGEGNSVIENTSDRAIRVYTGTFAHWDGSLQISGLSNRALEADRAALEIVGLTVTGNPDTGKDLIAIYNSKFSIVNLDLSDSGRNGLQIQGSQGSLSGIIRIDGSHRDGMRIEQGSAVTGGWWDPNEPGRPEYTIQVLNSGEHGIQVEQNSSLTLDNVLVDGSAENGISIRSGSTAGGGWRNPEIQNLPEYMIKVVNSGNHGVQVEHGSLASVNSIEVSNNGRGVSVSQNSIFRGGWKDEDDTNLPEYTILIENNRSWALEVQQNSNVQIDNVKISGNALEPQTNDQGDTYVYSVRINEGSTGRINQSLITGNGGLTIDILNNSKFNINNTTITDNGLNDDSGNFSFRGIQVLFNSHLSFDDSTLTHNTQDSALSIAHYSIGHINNVNITNTEGRAFDAGAEADVSFNNGKIDSAGNACIGIGKSKTNFNQVAITTGGFCLSSLSEVNFNEGSLDVISGWLWIDESKVDFNNLPVTINKDGLEVKNGAATNFDNVDLITENININNDSYTSFHNGTTLNAGNEYGGNLQINASNVNINNLNFASVNISGGSVNFHDSNINNEQGHALDIGGGADVNFQRGSIRESDNSCISIGGAKAHFNEVPITTGGFCIDSDSDVYIGSGSVTLTNGNLFANDSKLNMNNLPLSITDSLSFDRSKAYFDNVTINTQNVDIRDSDVSFNNGSITRADDGCIGINGSKANFNTVNVTSGALCLSASDIDFSNGPLTLTNWGIWADDVKFVMNNLDYTGGPMGFNNNSRINLNSVNITTAGVWNSNPAVISVENSKLWLENANITVSQDTTDQVHSGLFLRKADVEIKGSTITATNTWPPDWDPSTDWGSLGIASENSQITIHPKDDQIETSIGIQAGAYPILASEGTKIRINGVAAMSSAAEWDDIRLQGGSMLELGGNMSTVTTLSKIYMDQETIMRMSDKWKFNSVGCNPDPQDSNGNPIFRKPVIFLNGSATTSINPDCITVENE